jgi:hypothetical protein
MAMSRMITVDEKRINLASLAGFEPATRDLEWKSFAVSKKLL